MLTTETLPAPLIDGLGMFNVFASEAAAEAIAALGRDKSEREDMRWSYEVVQRKDGKFLVVCHDQDDDVCFYIPAAMVQA